MKWFLLVCLCPALAWSQPLRFMDCPVIHFLGPACAPVPPPPAPEVVAPAPEEFPLFAPSLMAADTPPLFIRLLENPSEENAEKFLAWQAERAARIQEVQQLIKRLTQEPKHE